MLKKIISAPLLQSLVLATLILTTMLLRLPPLVNLESAHFDFWAEHFRPPDDLPIAIVAIDDKSVRQMGDWSWSRSKVTELVKQLSAHEAQALGICLLYSQPDINPGRQEIQSLSAEIAEHKFKGGRKTTQFLERLLSQSERNLNHDQQLISSIRRARNVVLPIRFGFDQAESSDEAPSGLLKINSLKTPVAIEQRTAALITKTSTWRPSGNGPAMAYSVRPTFAELAGKASALGHLNMVPDADGCLRYLPLFIDYRGRLYPALALQLALKQIGISIRDVTIHKDTYGAPLLSAGHLRIPMDPTFRLLINHNSDWASERIHAFSDVLDGTLDAAFFRDKIVLVGITAEDMAPTYRLGNQAGVSEVEITANALARILSPARLSRPSWAMLLEIVILLYFACLLTFVVPRVNLRIGAFILLFFLATWYAAGVGLLLGYGYWIKPYGPVLLAVVGFVILQLTTLSRKRQEERMESCKTLGLSYQGQGMLDMAFDQYRQCPVKDESVRNLLYNLALDFERKRMFNKAMAIYRHIQTGGVFKDIKKRMARLAALDNPLAATLAASKGEPTLQMDDSEAKPVFGRYEILSELGHGAMGTVYLGRDPKINRKVAIKTLAYAEVEESELPEVKARFFREAEAAGQLSHPNIVSIYDAGEEHDMAYIAMELLKGKDLTHQRKPGKLLSVGRVLTIVADVTAALDYAHGQGVIHRDIKPGNIMLLKDGRVKVTDFGIARVVDSTATRTGIILGTPSYMSPEQVTDKKLDGRSDLFALGIVFYELLAGTKPFKGDNISATMHAIIHTPHPPLKEIVSDIPDCVAAIVDKMLAKGLSRRFKSAAHALKAIEACRSEMV